MSRPAPPASATRSSAAILIGTYVLSAGYYDAYYLKALKVRRRIADDFDQAFETVDALLTPPRPRPRSGSARTPPIRWPCT